MTTYAINLNLGSSTQPEASTPDTAEADEAATPFDSWLGWLDEARDAIDQGGGDCQDLDSLLAVILDYVAAGPKPLSPLGRNARHTKMFCAKPGFEPQDRRRPAPATRGA